MPTGMCAGTPIWVARMAISTPVERGLRREPVGGAGAEAAATGGSKTGFGGLIHRQARACYPLVDVVKIDLTSCPLRRSARPSSS